MRYPYETNAQIIGELELTSDEGTDMSTSEEDENDEEYQQRTSDSLFYVRKFVKDYRGRAIDTSPIQSPFLSFKSERNTKSKRG